MPPKGVPCPNFLGVLAVSPLHSIACPGTQLPHAFCTGQGLSTPHSLPAAAFPDSMAQPTPELLSCSGFCMCSHDPPLLSPGVLRRLLLLTFPAHCLFHPHPGRPSWKLSRKKPAVHHHPQAASRHGPPPASCHVSAVTPCILFLPVPFPSVWRDQGQQSTASESVLRLW